MHKVVILTNFIFNFRHFIAGDKPALLDTKILKFLGTTPEAKRPKHALGVLNQ